MVSKRASSKVFRFHFLLSQFACPDLNFFVVILVFLYKFVEVFNLYFKFEVNFVSIGSNSNLLGGLSSANFLVSLFLT